MKTINVSVLTPIYNHNPEYVRICLESLKKQTMQEIEFILIDNEAIPESKEIIQEYVASDKRFRCIRIEKNKGYGYAMNLGLKESTGKYIGIVESDDFVDENMYSDLYNIASNTNVDIVKSQYELYFGNKQQIEKPSVVNYPKKNLYKVQKKEEMIYPYFGACYWTAIYRRSMIFKHKCFFSNYQGASGQDTTFLLQAWLAAKLVYTIDKKYYHYRIDNINSSRYNYLPVAYGSAKECEFLFDWITHNGQEYSSFEYSIFAKLIYNILLNQIQNRLSFGKVSLYNKAKCYYNAVRPIFKRLYKEYSQYLQDSFSSRDLQLLKLGIYHPIIFLLKIHYRNCFSKFFSISLSQDKRHRVLTLFGFKIKFKVSHNKKVINKVDLESIKQNIKEYYVAQKCNIEASVIHPNVFSQYKNIYDKKNLVIVGCGPSAVYYEPSRKCVHIGVNRAFKLNKIKFEYLFVQDWMDEDDMLQADEYLSDFCQKFYSIISDFRLKQVYPNIKRIPQYHFTKAKASPYILQSIYDRTFPILPFDIAYSPILDFGGTVFSAFQFALYTNPEKIYLVGCDCSTGHFHKEGSNGLGASLIPQIQWWKRLKGYLMDYYPQLEIISVNPVGLKGMFRDVYTQSYVDEHPELLNEDIEILKDEELVSK